MDSSKPGQVSIQCEFAMPGMTPEPGTMTFRPGSNYAWFKSADGKHKTMIHYKMLEQAMPDLEWPVPRKAK